MSRDTSGRITVLIVHAIISLWVFLGLQSKNNVCITHIEKYVPQILLNFRIIARQMKKSNRLNRID